MNAGDKPRFVIMGAGGFLGSHLTKHMVENYSGNVVAVSSQSPEKVSQKIQHLGAPFENLPNTFEVVNNEEVARASFLKETDIVVNCAFPWNRDGFEMAKGLHFHRDLFAVSARAGIRRFVNISSQSVYSQSRETPATENDELDLDTPYSVAKYSMEMLAAEMIDPSKLVNIRMASLVGIGYDIRILNRFIAQALEGQALRVNNPNQSFSYLDVRDACRGIQLTGLADLDLAHLNVVNIGTRSRVSLLQIAEVAVNAVSNLTGQKPVQIMITSSSDEMNGSKPHFLLDCNRAKKTMGFEAEIPLKDSAYWITSAMIKSGQQA